MVSYPVGASPDIIVKSVAAQMALYTSFSHRFLSTSRELGELNRQAGLRLMEETAAEMQKAMQIRSLTEAQSFLGEQSRMSMEKVRGYWLNMQKIASENWLGGAVLAEPAKAEDGGKQTAANDPAHEAPKAHEENVHASPLVEKLIAVAVAGDKSEDRPV